LNSNSCTEWNTNHLKNYYERSIKEPLPGVLGNKGTGTFIFWERGIFSNYFQGTRELLSRLLGTREH